MKNEELKNKVKEAYSQIANEATSVGGGISCCGTPHGLEEEVCAQEDGSLTLQLCHTMPEDYSTTVGYTPEANLGLGCGLPVAFAKIKEGSTVVDLGCGAGNDAFVARTETGPKGKVIGVDLVPEMVARATKVSKKLGYSNVQFLAGDIEHLPLPAKHTHIVVSNCVLNLVPNKTQAFQEIFRILKPGGHFSISDIITIGALPDALRINADAYTGCIGGAVDKDTYLQIIHEAGFINVTEQKLKPIALPKELLEEALSKDELALWKAGKHGIFSLQVYGERPKNRFWWF